MAVNASPSMSTHAGPDLNSARPRAYLATMETSTLDEIDRLTTDERLTLIGRLWDSLADADVPLPDAQRAELENRLASFEEERSRGVTWRDLEAELTARAP